MSLADELLADLEEGGEEVMEDDASADEEADTIDDVTTKEMDTTSGDSIHSIAKLHDSKQVGK